MARALTLCLAVSLVVSSQLALAEEPADGVVSLFGQTLFVSEALVTDDGGFVYGSTIYVETEIPGEPVDGLCVTVDSDIAVEGPLAAVTEGDHVSLSTGGSADACIDDGGHWLGAAVQVCDAEIEVVVGGGPGKRRLGCITLRLNAELEPADGFIIIDNIDG